jgi:lysophospholipase L1-like esterase
VIEERKQEIGPQNPNHSFYKLQIGAADATVYEKFEEAVLRFSELARKAHVPLVAAYVPDASKLHEPERQYANSFMKAAARKAGFDLVDLTPRFEAYADPRELHLFPLDTHTSPTGHRVIAEAIAEILLRKGLPPPQ